jgi:hypothetical protein
MQSVCLHSSDSPDACVPINPVSTNGICSPKAAAENLGPNNAKLHEISSV